MEIPGQEGWLLAGALMLLPFIILPVLVKLFLPAGGPTSGHARPSPTAPAA
jgi:hypothetical protein